MFRFYRCQELGFRFGFLHLLTRTHARTHTQDALTSVRLLDSFCYTNVFVDEGREVLGVKIDKDTPLGYVTESTASLDQFLELFGDEEAEEE
jgi:hypothetical protein